MDQGEEGTEEKVSATTSFIAGQLMMFISIYYAHLHLALAPGGTPYLYGSTRRKGRVRLSPPNLGERCDFEERQSSGVYEKLHESNN
uniref:Uncharacterized protein n=1 Tax=Brassica oleracea var. oleracea TaxID=109376 RepID=A0A0D2ZUH0_BRAOL